MFEMAWGLGELVKWILKIAIYHKGGGGEGVVREIGDLILISRKH